jgi:hypothetical protein
MTSRVRTTRKHAADLRQQGMKEIIRRIPDTSDGDVLGADCRLSHLSGNNLQIECRPFRPLAKFVTPIAATVLDSIFQENT